MNTDTRDSDLEQQKLRQTKRQDALQTVRKAPQERLQADGTPRGWPAALQDKDEVGDENTDFKPLDREEAQKLLASMPSVSAWHVVVCQCGVGAVVALLAWMLTGQLRMAWSAAYGALAVVIPAALFVRGLMRQRGVTHGGAALTGFFVWEMVKIVLTVAMLVAAPRLIPELNWLALLAGFVVTMQVYWAAMWFRPAPKPSPKRF